MADEHCRITVVGERKRVDLALPARAPIAEYIPDLTRLCGQADSEALPSAWSLALPGARPFSPGSSLDESGVVDGAVLYLRDVVEGEYDSPIVADVEELVEEAAKAGRSWNARNRAASVLNCGLAAVQRSLGRHDYRAVAFTRRRVRPAERRQDKCVVVEGKRQAKAAATGR